ncbi:uncharacterized protein LOC108101698 [Drosophila ficusphila]|uniref:uncharacterized protein LOC108101698 n=1 Tax=Drosophila ficusphila TaxID=30025 RepID=UPI0007E60487|nr:uncharacterized protein LOC108101698 [Drosophila ficusphila]
MIASNVGNLLSKMDNKKQSMEFQDHKISNTDGCPPVEVQTLKTELKNEPLMESQDQLLTDSLDEKLELQKHPLSDNLENPASQISKNRSKRKIPPMPAEETMRHSIADNLMEILVSDALQARSRILDILQQIDDKQKVRK